MTKPGLFTPDDKPGKREAWLVIAITLACFWYVVGSVLWSLTR